MNIATQSSGTRNAMLQIGARRFAPNASALVDSLFNPGGTADGIYKVRKHGVMFSKPNGDPFAFLVANPGQSMFFVTASKQHDGRTRYMYGLSKASAIALGVSEMSFGEQCDKAEAVWQSLHS